MSSGPRRGDDDGDCIQTAQLIADAKQRQVRSKSTGRARISWPVRAVELVQSVKSSNEPYQLNMERVHKQSGLVEINRAASVWAERRVCGGGGGRGLAMRRGSRSSLCEPARRPAGSPALQSITRFAGTPNGSLVSLTLWSVHLIRPHTQQPAIWPVFNGLRARGSARATRKRALGRLSLLVQRIQEQKRRWEI